MGTANRKRSKWTTATSGRPLLMHLRAARTSLITSLLPTYWRKLHDGAGPSSLYSHAA